MLTKLTAYLAHPYFDIPQKLSSIEFNEQVSAKIFSLLESNKVLSSVLSFRNSTEFPMKNKVLSKLLDSSCAFADSSTYMLNLRSEFLDIMAKFNEHSIRTVLIKSLNTLPLDSDNFDILIMKKDLSASVKVLKNSGFVQINWYREPYKWLFRKVKKDESLMAVHLHTAIAWDGIEFVDVEDLWKKYQEKEIDGVIMGFPSPEHHLLITTAHAFFENREFRLGDLEYLIQDVQGNNIDWEYISNYTIHDGWSDPFYGLLSLASHAHMVIFGDKLIHEKAYKFLPKGGKMNGCDLAEKLVDEFNEKQFLPMKIATTAVALQLAKKILRTPRISLLKKAKMTSCLFNNAIKRRLPIYKKHPVFLTCFIGQDGTGKTTHAKYAIEELKQMSKIIKVKYIWSRGFGYSFQPFLLVVRRLLLGSKSPEIAQSSYFNRRANLLKREPMKSLWAYIMIIDHLLHLLKVWLALSLGYMVICDRSIIDTLIDVKCNLGKPINKFLERQIERLTPKPEIAFIMDTETSELVKRRPDIDSKLITCKRLSYLKYLHRKGFIVVNTSDDLERNRKEIFLTLLKNFFSQFR